MREIVIYKEAGMTFVATDTGYHQQGVGYKENGAVVGAVAELVFSDFLDSEEAEKPTRKDEACSS